MKMDYLTMKTSLAEGFLDKWTPGKPQFTRKYNALRVGMPFGAALPVEHGIAGLPLPDAVR